MESGKFHCIVNRIESKYLCAVKFQEARNVSHFIFQFHAKKRGVCAYVCVIRACWMSVLRCWLNKNADLILFIYVFFCVCNFPNGLIYTQKITVDHHMCAWAHTHSIRMCGAHCARCQYFCCCLCFIRLLRLHKRNLKSVISWNIYNYLANLILFAEINRFWYANIFVEKEEEKMKQLRGLFIGS